MAENPFKGLIERTKKYVNPNAEVKSSFGSQAKNPNGSPAMTSRPGRSPEMMRRRTAMFGEAVNGKGPGRKPSSVVGSPAKLSSPEPNLGIISKANAAVPSVARSPQGGISAPGPARKLVSGPGRSPSPSAKPSPSPAKPAAAAKPAAKPKAEIAQNGSMGKFADGLAAQAKYNKDMAAWKARDAFIKKGLGK